MGEFYVTRWTPLRPTDSCARGGLSGNVAKAFNAFSLRIKSCAISGAVMSGGNRLKKKSRERGWDPA